MKNENKKVKVKNPINHSSIKLLLLSRLIAEGTSSAHEIKAILQNIISESTAKNDTVNTAIQASTPFFVAVARGKYVLPDNFREQAVMEFRNIFKKKNLEIDDIDGPDSFMVTFDENFPEDLVLKNAYAWRMIEKTALDLNL